MKKSEKVQKENKRMGRPVTVPAGETPAARLRRLEGWSQSEMAAVFDVSHTTIGRWERGEMEPSGPARQLLKIYMQKHATTDSSKETGNNS